tara:strand:- start:143 stop:790 length:648 start_codon:yes stop_codon:yes gene_type:complete
MWQNQLTQLKKKYKVIIPELKQGETINEFSKHTLKSLPDTFSIIGFSMGGFIALNLAINYPKRIDDLVLVGTNARSVSKERRILLKKSLLELNKKNYIERFSLSSFQSYFAKKNQNKKKYLKLIKTMVKNSGFKCLTNQTKAILNRPELIGKLTKIKSRCLIISGSQDRLSTKEMNIELHTKIKNSEIYFVTKSGHFVMLEEFEKFNKKILKWLN